jgi:hypothetical protein
LIEYYDGCIEKAVKNGKAKPEEDSDEDEKEIIPLNEA